MASPQAAIDDALKAAGSGVALFGKSGCPFCKKAKKALYGIGVHPTVVELDQAEGGASIQKKLEALTGKSTVPNVWLDGKFIGGSEEIIAGVTSGMFDAVEKKEIIEMEEEAKVPIVQGPDALKVGDKVPDSKVWVGFNSDDFVSLADYGKDKNILVVGLPGAFTPT
jgi:glutaredoxin 3